MLWGREFGESNGPGDPLHTSRRPSRAILMTLVLGSGFCSRLLPALMPVGPLFHAGSGVSTCSSGKKRSLVEEA